MNRYTDAKTIEQELEEERVFYKEQYDKLTDDQKQRYDKYCFRVNWLTKLFFFFILAIVVSLLYSLKLAIFFGLSALVVGIISDHYDGLADEILGGRDIFDCSDGPPAL